MTLLQPCISKPSRTGTRPPPSCCARATATRARSASARCATSPTGRPRTSKTCAACSRAAPSSPTDAVGLPVATEPKVRSSAPVAQAGIGHGWQDDIVKTMTAPRLRPATRADLLRIHEVRHGTAENRLSNPALVTEAEVVWYLEEAIFLVSEDE